MFYSLTFGDTDRRNTWDDWHIVPTSRPHVPALDVQGEYVEIPNVDGALDLTDVLGESEELVTLRSLKIISGSWEFLVMNDYQEWNVLYNQMLRFLHGKKMPVRFESNPHHYYTGRFYIGSWSSEKDNSKVTINYDLEPYVYYEP